MKLAAVRLRSKASTLRPSLPPPPVLYICARSYVSYVSSCVSDCSPSSSGHGFSALNTAIPPPSGAIIATAEINPEPPSPDDFPDPVSWQTNKPESGSEGHEHGKPDTEMVGTVTSGERRLIPARSPTLEGTGYTHGKWLWEWEIVSCSERVSIGVCGREVAAVSPAGVPLQKGVITGKKNGTASGSKDVSVVDIWMYRSDGFLTSGGRAMDRVCPGGRFENGDVIGVELDVDEGIIAFLKNDTYVGAQFKIVRSVSVSTEDGADDGEKGDVEGDSDGGLYPCVALQGSGDAVILLGLKNGSGTIKYRTPPKDTVGKEGGAGREVHSGGEGIAAALSAAVATANADAEAMAAAAAATVGGGDKVAIAAAERVASFERSSFSGEESQGGEDVSGNTEGEPSTGNDDAAQGASDPVPSAETDAAAAVAAPASASTPTEGAVADAPSGVEDSASASPSAVSADATSLAPPPPPPPPLPGTVTVPSVPSFYPSYFEGEFVGGLKHGPGVLKLNGKGGYWTGRWFQGLQHGVHLLVEAPSKKGHVEDDGTPTAWLFDRGVKVRV